MKETHRKSLQKYQKAIDTRKKPHQWNWPLFKMFCVMSNSHVLLSTSSKQYPSLTHHNQTHTHMEKTTTNTHHFHQDKRFQATPSWCTFFYTIKKCGLLPVNHLAACQPHNLQRERWGLLHYGLKPGHVEWGQKKEKEGGFWWLGGVEVSVMGCFINSCQCQDRKSVV